MTAHHGVTQPPGPDVHQHERQIARLENQIQALAFSSQQTLETLINVGKVTGVISEPDLEALRGQLIALRSIRAKK